MPQSIPIYLFGKADRDDDYLATTANKGLLMFAGENMQI